MGLHRECRLRVPTRYAFAAAPECHKNHKPRYPDEKDVPGREDTGTSRGASFLYENGTSRPNKLPNTIAGDSSAMGKKPGHASKRRRQGAYKVKINRTFLYFIAHKAQKGTNCVCLVVFFASYGRMFLQEILFLYRCTVTTPVRYAILISTMPGKRAVHMKEKRIFCPLNQRKDLAR